MHPSPVRVQFEVCIITAAKFQKNPFLHKILKPVVKTNPPAKVKNMTLPILNMDVTPFVQFLVFVAYIGLIFGLSVELIGRNPLNMLRVRDKEEGSAMNAEGSVITSEDSAITSEGSAIKNNDSVKERENSEGNTCLAD